MMPHPPECFLVTTVTIGFLSNLLSFPTRNTHAGTSQYVLIGLSFFCSLYITFLGDFGLYDDSKSHLDIVWIFKPNCFEVQADITGSYWSSKVRKVDSIDTSLYYKDMLDNILQSKVSLPTARLYLKEGLIGEGKAELWCQAHMCQNASLFPRWRENKRVSPISWQVLIKKGDWHCPLGWIRGQLWNHRESMPS